MRIWSSSLLRRIVPMMMALLLALPMSALAGSMKAVVASSSAKLYQSPTSSSASVKLTKGMSVTVKEVKNGWAKVKCNGVSGYMKTAALESASKSDSNSSSGSHSGSDTSWKSKVVAKQWFHGGAGVLKKGHYGYIYDIKSGYTIKVKRMGGVNHADIEPATASDASKLKKLGSSWSARPVILCAGGKYVAASINTKAHGDDTISSNNYDGQICLHMVGSKTHGGDAVRSDHQAAIEKAYKWAHK